MLPTLNRSKTTQRIIANMTAKNNKIEDGRIRLNKRGSAELFITNRRPFCDSRLSWGARGLLAFMLSCPNWQGTDDSLIDLAPSGAHKLKAMLGELKNTGYVHRYRQNDQSGQFVWITEVYERPEDNPHYDRFDALMNAIEHDEGKVAYRPVWNSFTGSPQASIFLQRVISLWVHNGRKPFFKFSRPCKNSNYGPGESWEEELGMRRGEFETARGAVSIRTGGHIDPLALVSYWVDASHLTWYAFNESATIQMGSTDKGRSGFVYLLCAKNGLYKIGLSVDPSARLKSINKQMSGNASLLHTIPADDRYAAERCLHEMFASKRQEGEWFSLSSGDVDFIRSLDKFENGDFSLNKTRCTL